MRKPELTLHAAARITRVLLLRHGESTFNQQGRYRGCCDEPVLTERGLRTTGAEPPDSMRRGMRDGCFSVLHYPDAEGVPVLQALNIPVAVAATDAGLEAAS